MIPFLSSCSRSRQRSSALIGFFPDTSTGVAHRTKNQLFLFFRCCVVVLPCSKIQATGYGAELFTISHILKRHQKENFIGRKKERKLTRLVFVIGRIFSPRAISSSKFFLAHRSQHVLPFAARRGHIVSSHHPIH
jgi:hypothetical protein